MYCILRLCCIKTLNYIFLFIFFPRFYIFDEKTILVCTEAIVALTIVLFCMFFFHVKI